MNTVNTVNTVNAHGAKRDGSGVEMEWSGVECRVVKWQEGRKEGRKSLCGSLRSGKEINKMSHIVLDTEYTHG